ncbi:MAG: hypothetical protein P8Y12_12300, partial [Gammaproteobacteria bacterium]
GGAVSRILIFLSVLSCFSAVVVWCLYTLKYAPRSLSIFVSFLMMALIAEWLLQRSSRTIEPQLASGGKPDNVPR